jgi:hypothetical protein
MQTSSSPHGTIGSHRRLVLLAVVVTAVAVMAGVSLAELEAPADVVSSAGAPASDDSLAAAARSHHAPLAEAAPTASPGDSAAPDDGEPLIRSAE